MPNKLDHAGSLWASTNNLMLAALWSLTWQQCPLGHLDAGVARSVKQPSDLLRVNPLVGIEELVQEGEPGATSIIDQTRQATPQQLVDTCQVPSHLMRIFSRGARVQGFRTSLTNDLGAYDRHILVSVGSSPSAAKLIDGHLVCTTARIKLK